MDTPPSPSLEQQQVLLNKKIQELEDGQENLRCQISKFILHGSKLGYYGNQRLLLLDDPSRIGNEGHDGNMGSSSSFRHSSSNSRREVVGPNFTNELYLNILQSMGQSVHIFDSNGRVIYWNRSAERLYGYSASEAVGQYVTDLIIDPNDREGANEIIERCSSGENWTGQFPVNSYKLGKRFEVTGTCTPLCDDLGRMVGIICVSGLASPFLEVQWPSSGRDSSSQAYPSRNQRTSDPTTEPGDSQQPLQVAIASKISNLASRMTNKVRLKIRPGDINTMERESQSRAGQYPDQGFSETVLNGAFPPRGDILPSRFGVPSKAACQEKFPGQPFGDSGDEVEGKFGIRKIITSRAGAWVSKKVIPWPRKESEQVGSVARTTHGVWPWSNHVQENDFSQQKRSDTNVKPKIQVEKSNRFGNEASCSQSSSFNVTSTTSASTGGSTSSSVFHNVNGKTDSFTYDILREDLTIGEQLGQGSCGTVFRALWCGLDVAVKVFSKLEYSEELVHSFRQEMSFMKRLQHPNVVLFMGAVTSHQQLCIVTEFLPRGSLFQLLQRIPKLYWKRRIHMALDIARGMNYLHHCDPPIIHCNLKSSNLLVDKNLTVKVGDFGLSQLKYQPYLTTRIAKGTPQWMAPEVLRGDPADEKSDVYSYGVILWELATQKIPWGNLNSMQVIGAVGFKNERIEIPKDIDPGWVSIIECCWHSEPKCRPTFQELLVKLNDLLRHYFVQAQENLVKPG